MKRKFIYFVATLLPLLLFPFSNAHAQTYISVNAVYCPSEHDVIELAEARTGFVLETLMTQKIQSGVCAAPNGVNKKVGMLIKRVTPRKKIPYYCFREELKSGELSEQHFCVMQKYILPLRTVVAQRRGDYTVKQHADRFHKIECAEGGTVTIERRGEEYFRISDALQLTAQIPNPPSVPAGADLERAIRDGCKGVDYLAEEARRGG